jgi:ribosome recycling factor
MDRCKQVNLFLLSVMVLVFGGCDSTSMERSDAARISLQTMDSDVQSAIRQLDDTGRSLDNLMSVSQSDLNKVFDDYSNNVSQLVTLEKKFSTHADEMKSRGEDYFEEWQKEGTKYKNARIQQLSDQRRATLAKRYDTIAENSIGVNEAFKLYVSDVKEIQEFLSNDLTANGISAIAPTSQKIINEGDSLMVALENVQTAIQKAREEMSQSRSVED